ncbi:MAG: hypothetical protein ACI4RM_08810 [Ruminococcus sp.]
MYKKIISLFMVITLISSLFMLNSCRSGVNAKAWGFENLADMGNKMIKVLDYNVKGTSDDYVVVSKDRIFGYLFEDGNMLRISADIDETMSEFDMSELDGGKFENKYEIVDNDNLNISNGLTTIYIEERITSEYRDDFVILEMNMGKAGESGKYIPYSLIKFPRGLEYTETEEEYKLYLK